MDNVETWLRQLKESMQKSLAYLLKKLIKDIEGGVPCEDWALKVIYTIGLKYLGPCSCTKPKSNFVLFKKVK